MNGRPAPPVRAGGPASVRPLERAIGHQFQDPALLAQALTHRSASAQNNERLEFLGDAVLGMVAAEMLYERFAQMSEGALTRCRALLVRRESLAALARALDLGDYMHLGAGELRTGGRGRDSLLADALEALIGAVHLDAGIDASRGLVRRLLADQLAGIDMARTQKDAKTRLQEYLQGRGLALPDYAVECIRGQPHAQIFTVSCTVAAAGASRSGEGSSRRQAEQRAAERMLELLQTPAQGDAPAPAASSAGSDSR